MATKSKAAGTVKKSATKATKQKVAVKEVNLQKELKKPTKEYVPEAPTFTPSREMKSAIRTFLRNATTQEKADALKEKHFTWHDSRGTRCESAVVNIVLDDYIQLRLYNGDTKTWEPDTVKVDL